MNGITITIWPDERQLNDLRRAIERLISVGRSPRVPLGRIGLYGRRDAQQRLRARTKSWGPHSGRLSKSIAIMLGEDFVAWGSNLVYARKQQEGGRIDPKGVYLAIPAQAHLRRRGVWPRDLPRDSMRFHPATEIKIGKHSWIGPALIRRGTLTTDEKGKKKWSKGASEVMFALLKSVNIRGRPYLVFDDKGKAFALRQFELEYQKALRGS